MCPYIYTYGADLECGRVGRCCVVIVIGCYATVLCRWKCFRTTNLQLRPNKLCPSISQLLHCLGDRDL